MYLPFQCISIIINNKGKAVRIEVKGHLVILRLNLESCFLAYFWKIEVNYIYLYIDLRIRTI